MNAKTHNDSYDSCAVIITAAGQGTRTQLNIPKQYAKISFINHYEPIITQTIRQFIPHAKYIQPVIAQNHAELYENALKPLKNHKNILKPITGAKTRQESVHNGLKALIPHKPKFVLIHDAARPFITYSMIQKIIQLTIKTNTATIPIITPNDSICTTQQNSIAHYLNRQQIGLVQTPQAFLFQDILNAHQKLAQNNENSYNDDASIAIASKIKCNTTQADPNNIKITTQYDLNRSTQYEYHSTSAVDVHAFGDGSSITLCGVKIPHSQALIGHSDADVALHALCDAILAAANQPDIGTCFPPSDPQWKNTDSSIFIQFALNKLQQNDSAITFADITIICEQPKISPHRDKLIQKLSQILSLNPTKIAVKATTTEKLGFLGRSEGIAALANITVKSMPNTTP